MSSIDFEEQASKIVEHRLGVTSTSIKRFPTGLAHYVYDVETKEGEQVVVRIADLENMSLLSSGVYWNQKLKPMGVPLPKLLDVDLEDKAPFVILERLPGTDLGFVYDKLSGKQKQEIVKDLVQVQKLVGTLPKGTGFGYVDSYEGVFPHSSWGSAVTESLNRSRERIDEAGVFSPSYVEQVLEIANDFGNYFSEIEPVPFLDDTTTKNVIIGDGRLTGIVDVDELCFGDSLFVVGLTRMALIADKHELSYIHYWCDELGLAKSKLKVLDFYTLLFCVNFMSEIGHRFNQGMVIVDEQRVEILKDCYNHLIERLR